VAVAGPNQVAYAFVDGLVDVELDGSGSYDEESDSLSYIWKWTIGTNQFEANSVAPTIQLPTGVHTIELVVSDGDHFSERDYCTVEIIEPIETVLSIIPRIVSCRNRGWLFALLSPPSGYEPDDISAEPVVLYPFEIEAIYQHTIQWGTTTVVLAVFKESDICEMIEPGSLIEVKAVSKLVTGQYFYGASDLRIIPKRRF
jgi:hypothetical protein